MITLLDMNGGDIHYRSMNLPIEEIGLNDIARSYEIARMSKLLIVYDHHTDKAKILKNIIGEQNIIIRVYDIPTFIATYLRGDPFFSEANTGPSIILT